MKVKNQWKNEKQKNQAESKNQLSKSNLNLKVTVREANT